MIRVATKLDILSLLALGEQYSKEAKYHDNLPYDMSFATEQAAWAIDDANQNILLSVQDGKVVGFIWGILSCLPWSPVPLALDNVLFVLPEYRGKADGVRLIRAYESWALEKGAKVVSLSIGSGVTTERTGLLYERMGYQLIGTCYRKEL